MCLLRPGPPPLICLVYQQNLGCGSLRMVPSGECTIRGTAIDIDTHHESHINNIYYLVAAGELGQGVQYGYPLRQVSTAGIGAGCVQQSCDVVISEQTTDPQRCLSRSSACRFNICP